MRITFHTHTGSPTGYAQSAAELIIALYNIGVDVHYLYTADDPLYEPPADDPLVTAIRQRRPTLTDPQVVYNIAPMFAHNSGRYKIGYTMIETDRITDEWTYYCNLMDEIWVPTDMQRDTFAKSGVTRPIYRTPLGVNPHKYTPYAFTPRWTGTPCIRFLAVGWWQLRKRWDVLLDTFSKEFQHTTNVTLICKIHSEEPYDEINEQVELFTHGRPHDNILILNGSAPWWELAQLYRICHAYVTPTAGEGWGCTPVEAIASGTPVITTNCQGPGEILADVPGVTLVQSDLAPCPIEHPYYTGSNWWAIRPDDLASAMHDLIDNYHDHKAAAMVGSRLVRQKLTYTQSALRIAEHITRINHQLDDG